MKKIQQIILCLFLIALVISCKKENIKEKEDYSSVENFFEENCSPMQTYTINASEGGSFTTPQGTIVTIPANVFVNQNYNLVTGNIEISFKDIYKRSDMLLNNLSTVYYTGEPLKSGGMFYIKVMQGNEELQLMYDTNITIEQPLNNWAIDSAMTAMRFLDNDTITNAWIKAPLIVDSIGSFIFFDTLQNTNLNYIYNLYKFSSPLTQGTWCNSDNISFFETYQQTILNIKPLDDVGTYHMEVFLVFTDVNSMIHVYYKNGSFPYLYAPIGLNCTVVSLGVKDGTIYSCFKPITIGDNETVEFSLKATTTEEFKSQLEALN